MKKLLKFILMIALCCSCQTTSAEDTGKLINNRCRANLKALNEGTAKFLAENDSGLPSWANFDTISSSLIDKKYLSKPEPPTRDCKYFLVSVSRDDYQWYCDLHGVLEGEKTVTFMYHEHRLMGKTTSRYAKIEKYRDHTLELLRWTDYHPTPVEKLKYHYNSNPLTTIILGIVGIILLIFVYRNVT
ncbi:MAG: hypothetical protein PHD82_14210 [Candidatus Riflebacteria bacterium]|nr:hypothetical protein [Candidatus Riflebacteria bacterium]